MTLSTVLRRLRGTTSIAATWALGWGIAAGALGGIGMAVVGRLYSVPVELGTMIQAFAIAGTLAGAVSGIGFSAIVSTIGRRRSLDTLSPLRVGLGSALPAIAIGAAIVGWDPVFLTATTLFAAGAGAATISLARRDERRAIEAADPAVLSSPT